jgi:signal peptidase I
MATSTILVYVLVFLVGAVLTGLLVSLANRWLNIVSANFFNATIAAIGAGFVAFLMECLRGVLEGWLPGSSVAGDAAVTVGPSWPLLAVQILLTLGLIIWIVKTVLFATWPEAVKAGITMAVLGGLVLFGLDYGLKQGLVDRVRIATDDMAPMILGSHAQVTCAKCGATYPVAAPNPNTFKKKAPSTYATTCPVCAQNNSLPAEAKIFSGDWIAVGKGHEPERWGLVLTRIPADSGVDRVSRVVGLPGETIDIADGNLFLNKKRLQRKPGEADDMWILVHDSRHIAPPAGKSSDVPRLKGGKGSNWKNEGNIWSCTNDRAEADTLLFTGKITDRLTYNPRSSGDDVTERPVGDVKLDCAVQSMTNGSMGFDWSFYDHAVSATISNAGDVELVVYEKPNGRNARRVASARGKLTDPISRSNNIAFIVCDGLATLTERDVPVASALVGPQDLETFRKNASDAIEHCRVSVSIASGSLTLSRVLLYRDVYYRRVEGLPSQSLVGVDPKYLPGGKGSPYVKLPEDTYFVLGDDSTRARDSRMVGPLHADDIRGIPRGIHNPFGRWHLFQ